MVFTFLFPVQFTAIRARVSVITCYAHSEKVELQYWLLLMLPHVGLVCIKSDKSDPFVSTLADPLVHLAKWLTLNEEKERRIIIIQNQRGSTLNDDWLSILIGPGLRPLILIGPWFRTRWKRTRDRRPVVGSLGHTDYWTSLMVTWLLFRTAQFGPDQILTRTDCWDAGFCCPKGRYDLVSLIISIYFHLTSKLKICHFSI